jgi:hypothetical protein
VYTRQSIHQWVFSAIAASHKLTIRGLFQSHPLRWFWAWRLWHCVSHITTCWVDGGICPSLSAFLVSPNMFINDFVRMQRIVLFQNVRFAVLASPFFSLCIILRWCEYRGFIKDAAQCVHCTSSQLFFSKRHVEPTQKIAHLFRSQLRPFKLYHVVSIHLAGMNFVAHSEASFWPFQSHGFHEFHLVWSSAKVHARRDDVVCVKVRVRRYEAVITCESTCKILWRSICKTCEHSACGWKNV